MNIKPLQDYVVAKKDQPIEKTKSGILLGNAKESPAYAIIEAIGPDTKAVKVGDKIIFKEYSTTNISLDNSDYLIIKESDILATL